MNLEPLVQVVSKLSPLVGGALGGPAGSVVGELIANLFGGSTTDPIQLAEKIKNDPSAQEKLISLAYAHQEALENLRVKDVDSARQRQVDIVKSTGKGDWILNLIALLYTGGFFGYVAFQMFYPATDKGVFHDLLNGYVLILSFFFGSAYQTVRNK